jgi:quinol monooxygenase YgiN
MSVQVIVSHHVADFPKWKDVFDEHEKVRREHGALGHALYQATTDPGEVVIVNTFDTAEGAKAFLDDPSLAEAMKRAGVDRAPTLTICREIETIAY